MVPRWFRNEFPVHYDPYIHTGTVLVCSVTLRLQAIITRLEADTTSESVKRQKALTVTHPVFFNVIAERYGL